MKTVSIIVPCYNEEKTIAKLLDGLRTQQFPIDDLEVIIADGLSEDGTRRVIEAYQKEFPNLNIQVVDNVQKTIPSGLNAAIRAASGEIIIRLDAHSIPSADYIVRCVDHLQQGMAENVGGVWDIMPGSEDWIGRSIAAAASHPLGVGDAGYRYATKPAYVDTVPFGAYRRTLLDKIGFYDETLLTNEDYELNVRIHQSGGRVYLDPSIRCVYFARPSLSGLAKQYARYGYWKAQMLRRYPSTIRWRQALPPLFVLGIILLILTAPFHPFFGYSLLTILAVYFGILLLTSIRLALQKRNGAFIMGVPLAVSVMHFCWGGGFLFNLINPKRIR
jgi:glycosyltransferase involved in cell wall biosynthesis